MTYDDLKTTVLEDAAAAHQKKLQGTRFREKPYVPDFEPEWHRYMISAVCAGTVPFPDSIPDSLTYSNEYVAVSNIGGLITLTKNGPGLRVTNEVGGIGKEFVVVDWDGELTAMTVDQAFRRGLREAEWTH